MSRPRNLTDVYFGAIDDLIANLAHEFLVDAVDTVCWSPDHALSATLSKESLPAC